MSTHTLALRVPHVRPTTAPAPLDEGALFAAARRDAGPFERALGLALVASAALPALFFTLVVTTAPLS